MPHSSRSLRILIAAITLVLVFAAICFAANPQACQPANEESTSRSFHGPATLLARARAATPDSQKQYTNKLAIRTLESGR